MAKAAFNRKSALFSRNKLVKCYIWNIALYGAETGTEREADQKQMENCKIVVLEKDGEDQLDRSCEK
jgi:hypothetical protein